MPGWDEGNKWETYYQKASGYGRAGGKWAKSAFAKKPSEPTADKKFVSSTVKNQIANALGRPAPQAQGVRIGDAQQGTAATIDPTRQDQFRQGQMSLADNLRAVMSGQQQGAGELAVQRQAQRALSNAAGAATMARGNNSAGAARAAARASGAIGLGAAGQAQQAALNDQMGARQMLSGVLGQGRGQDIDLATQQAQFQQQMNIANLDAKNRQIFEQAGLDQSTSLANLQARLQTMGLNDTQIASMLSQLTGISAADQAAKAEADRNRQQMMGALIAAGATAYAASDANLKSAIRNGDEEADAFMDSISATAFVYADEKFGAGERLGIIAQDAEITPLGARLVGELPGGEGKGIDHGAAISALLACVARLNNRLAELEGR